MFQNVQNTICPDGKLIQRWQSASYEVLIHKYPEGRFDMTVGSMLPKLPAIHVVYSSTTADLPSCPCSVKVGLSEMDEVCPDDAAEAIIREAFTTARLITQLFLKPILNGTYDWDSVEPFQSEYKVKQIEKMLECETNKDEQHYGASLSHWKRGINTLVIDAGGLQVLHDYYMSHETVLD